jgi:lipopolysaccharide transport system ATP-binding protein
MCDVVIALEDGRIIEQGDPGLVLANYRKRTVDRCRAAGGAVEVTPSARHGDGRVEVAGLEILGENGAPAATVRSGERVTVRVKLKFLALVENPVAGILIRSRIGVSVYGTNTELERVAIGPRRAGETAEVDFTFPCRLCPQEYTLTAASHDPDGSPHDWLEEAALFTVVDDRYTAGVANLKAEVRVR